MTLKNTQDVEPTDPSPWEVVKDYVHEQQALRQQLSFSQKPSQPTQPEPSKAVPGAPVLPSEQLTAEPHEIPGQSAKEEDWATSSDSEDEHTDDEHETRGKSRARSKSRGVSERTSLLAKEPSKVEQGWLRIRYFELTSLQKNVLKCACAYLIASLFTFVRPLSLFVGLPFDANGPVANAHFIATIATYYNPAKTVGSMIEANLFMFWGLLFSSVVCFGSMTTAVMLNRHGHMWISHVIIIVFWLSGASGLIAYLKLRVGKATFGSACSMTALIISVILCKEGSVHLGRFETDAILQMTFIVAIGTLISNMVCFTLWRGSATAKLQGQLNQTLDSFSTLITMLSKTFLLEEDAASSVEQLKKAINAHEACFSGLKVSLTDAKLELLDPRIQRSSNEYDAIVKSMTTLAQNLTGLRSGCTLQNDILRSRRHRRMNSSAPESSGAAFGNASEPNQAHHIQLTDPVEEQIIVFEQFKKHCGPKMIHLTNVVRRALKDLRTSFIYSRAGESTYKSEGYQLGSKETSQAIRFRAMRTELKTALQDFNLSHSRALKRLYRHYPTQDNPKPERGETTFEESNKPALNASKPNEAVFTIYFFLFAFEEFVRELDSLIEPFILVRQEEELLAARKAGLQSRYGSFLGWLFYLFTPQDQQDKSRYAVVRDRWAALFPTKEQKSPFPEFLISEETIQSKRAAGQGFLANIQFRIWQAGSWMRGAEVKFAIKTGLGAGLLGLPAFIPTTRPIWKQYRGEWAMISYMVVASLQSGQSNFNAFYRIAGTLLGALCAALIYHLFWEKPVELAIAGFLFSIPNFYLICAKPKYATTGRFILLAYNLTALYSYNRRQQDLDISLVAFQRSIAVAVGTIWAWIISTWIWPYEARVQLRHKLSATLLKSAYLYERLVALYSDPPPALIPQDKKAGEANGSLFTPEGQTVMRRTVSHFAAMELDLQKELIKLNGLLTQTSLEPRLKGAFPMAPYRQILNASQGILDQLHAIRTVTTRDDWFGDVRREFILPVQKFRREMVGSILLYFSLLATTISAKAPLPPYLPPAREARERLVTAIRQLDVVKRKSVRGSSTFLLYYAYSLAMLNIVSNLDLIGKLVQDLYGIVGGYAAIDAFEGLFNDTAAFDVIQRSRQVSQISSSSEGSDEERGRSE